MTKLLVLIQFSTLIIIAILSESTVLSDPVSLVLFALAIIIGLLPLVQKEFKVSVFPEVTKDMKLITDGIYKFIRHPMYLSVLLIAISFVIADPKPIMFFVLAILITNLHLKMNLEEIYLSHHFKEYSDYKKVTSRLIPFIY